MKEEMIRDLGFELHRDLLKTTEDFCKIKGGVPIAVMLTGFCAGLAGLLVNAPNKQHAYMTLHNCYETMRRMLELTPDTFFGKGGEVPGVN